MVLNLSCGIVVLWELLLEAMFPEHSTWYCCTLVISFKSNLSMVLIPSCGIVVLCKLLLEVKCFHSTQPELWYCCTLETTS